MMVCKRTIIVAAAGLSVCNAAWADHVDMRIVRDYPAGTLAVAHIHAWLQQQSRRGDAAQASAAASRCRSAGRGAHQHRHLRSPVEYACR